MLLRRVLSVATLALLLGTASPAADANVGDVLAAPLRWVGGALVGGGVDKLKAAADVTVADVDSRLTQQEYRVAGLAGELVADTKGKFDDSFARVDHGLEARILQLKTSASDVVDGLLRDVDTTLRDQLVHLQAVGNDLVANAGRELRQSLDRADTILRERTADLDRVATDFVSHTDDALKNRIDQLDEAVGRRLGDVDVIATKQRIALERTMLRVAVLIGLVVFVVFVMRGLWKRYSALPDDKLASIRGGARTARLLRELAPGLARPFAAALAGAALLFGLYQWLPLDAVREAEALRQLHVTELEASVARFDYARARFHASQLEYLEPETAAVYDGLAGKTELLRDLVVRPTMLATREGIATFDARVRAVERLLGPRPDADMLVMHAIIAWDAGSTRIDEHQAASLAARALRLRPRGFPLAPLARAYVETFLDAPYVPEGAGLGRDAATLAELEDALASAAPEDPGSPFVPLTELARRMRRLERTSTEHYVKMVEAHARLVALTKTHAARGELVPLFAERTGEAQQVVDAWTAFDAGLRKATGLGGPLLSNLFRLNDAVLTRALWFVTSKDTLEIGKRLEDLGTGDDSLALRIKLAPARIAWARRYPELFRGPAKQIMEFEETERFRAWEAWCIEFERAVAVLRIAERRGDDESTARWRTIRAAAALGLYIETADHRDPYGRKLAGGHADAPLGKEAVRPGEPSPLEQALRQRGPRLI